jgi:hypothetical protein
MLKARQIVLQEKSTELRAQKGLEEQREETMT